ncbi:hypothetical protein BGZ98_001459 [Dissophora globulifera]|nr:hypothetical protein BGZ98_001459 [Dissophora globulifera]
MSDHSATTRHTSIDGRDFDLSEADKKPPFNATVQDSSRAQEPYPDAQRGYTSPQPKPAGPVRSPGLMYPNDSTSVVLATRKSVSFQVCTSGTEAIDKDSRASSETDTASTRCAISTPTHAVVTVADSSAVSDKVALQHANNNVGLPALPMITSTTAPEGMSGISLKEYVPFDSQPWTNAIAEHQTKMIANFRSITQALDAVNAELQYIFSEYLTLQYEQIEETLKTSQERIARQEQEQGN